jgi:hypothetical protein
MLVNVLTVNRINKSNHVSFKLNIECISKLNIECISIAYKLS